MPRRKKRKPTLPDIDFDFQHCNSFEGPLARLAAWEHERLSAEIAQKILDLRKSAGLTLLDLAERVAATPGVVSRLEDADYRGHSFTVLTRVAVALGQHIEVHFVPKRGSRPEPTPEPSHQGRTRGAPPRLFSYVVDHDYGTAPNPYGGLCTLAVCKFSSSKKPNILELARPGDWVAGTGGVGPHTGGHGKLIYAMRVDEKITWQDFMYDPRFDGRADRAPRMEHGRFVLVSGHYYYFGARAVDIRAIPTRHLDHPFEKSGPSHRSDFSPEFIADFADWLERTYGVGVHGDPCGGRPRHASGCVSDQTCRRTRGRRRQKKARQPAQRASC